MFWLLFSLHGRINRMTFIKAAFLEIFVVSAIIYILLSGQAQEVRIPLTVRYAGAICLVLMIPLYIKRLHDMNRSARLVFLPLLPFVVYFVLKVPILAEMMASDSTVQRFIVAAIIRSTGMSMAIVVGFMIFMMMGNGTKGDNNYGPNPLSFGNVEDVK